MKIKVSEAAPRQLDHMVHVAIGLTIREDFKYGRMYYRPQTKPGEVAWDNTSLPYSTNWSQGGPIIERGKIAILPNDGHRFSQWHAFCWAPSQHDLTFEDGQSHNQRGPTPLIAAMRCLVASKLGDEAEVPDALTS